MLEQRDIVQSNCRIYLATTFEKCSRSLYRLNIAVAVGLLTPEMNAGDAFVILDAYQVS